MTRKHFQALADMVYFADYMPETAKIQLAKDLSQVSTEGHR